MKVSIICQTVKELKEILSKTMSLEEEVDILLESGDFVISEPIYVASGWNFVLKPKIPKQTTIYVFVPETVSQKNIKDSLFYPEDNTVRFNIINFQINVINTLGQSPIDNLIA